MDLSKPIALIDTSYCVFYRFNATKCWFKFRLDKDQTMDDIKLVENEEFVSKFKTMFFRKIYNFMKKYDIPNTNIVFCKDCPRKSIWRIPELPEYKATRKKINHICDFS